MSSEPLVVRAEGLSKGYRIGEREPYKALRDVITDAFKLRRRVRSRRPADWIWALSDVTFDIRQGEVLGLIGRNEIGRAHV